MCLDKVSKRKPKPTGFGWKLFRRKKGNLYGDVYTADKSRPIDKWLKEVDYRNFPERPAFEPDYPIGWHIFKRKKDTEYWAYIRTGEVENVHKVKYRKAHIQGKQASFDCVVAKEIKILPLKGE